MGRIKSVLNILSERLKASQARGDAFFVGHHVTSVDIYWTAFSTFFAPFSPDQCPMEQSYRDMGNWMGDLVRDVMDPALVVHRDRILSDYFKLPMWF